MTKDDLFRALKSTGIPYAADTWWPQKPPPLPYMLVVLDSVEERFGSGAPVAAMEIYSVELYTHGRSDGLEKSVIDAIRREGVPCGTGPRGIVDETDVYVARINATVFRDER